MTSLFIVQMMFEEWNEQMENDNFWKIFTIFVKRRRAYSLLTYVMLKWRHCLLFKWCLKNGMKSLKMTTIFVKRRSACNLLVVWSGNPNFIVQLYFWKREITKNKTNLKPSWQSSIKSDWLNSGYSKYKGQWNSLFSSSVTLPLLGDLRKRRCSVDAWYSCWSCSSSVSLV